MKMLEKYHIKTVSTNKSICTVVLLLSVVLLSGCSSWEPWVQPYEREILADPIMSFSRQPSIDSHFSHVYEVREGSHGAGTSIGGGCGCN